MVDIRVCDGLIEIGRQRENEFRRVLFPMTDVLVQYPDATFNVLNRRSADTSSYVVPASQISVEGTDVCWVLKASDLAYIGDGECEVIAYSGNTVAKDEIYTVRVLAALDEGMDPPDPSWDEYLADLSEIADRAETAETGSAENALKAEGYAVGRQNGEPVDQESPYYHGHAAYFAGEAGVSAATAAGSAGDAAGSAAAAGRSAGSAAGSATAAETAQIKAEAAQAAAESARDQITGMTAEATTLDPGESATASYSDGVLSLGIPRGADGQDGEDGADGYSPSAAVSKSGSTATITITDKTGTTTAEISDGQDGQDGADGYTPQRGVDYWTSEDQAVIISAVEEDVGEEISELKSEIDGKAPAIYQTASGDIVSFADGADGMPLSSCVVSIDPVQSGTGDPAPTNVRPISGWTEMHGAVSNAKLYDRSVNGLERGTISGSDGTNSGANTRLRTGYISVKPGTAYAIFTNFPYVFIHEYSDNAGTYIGHSDAWLEPPAQFTTGATTNYIRLVIAKATPATGTGHIDVYTSDFVYLDVLENSVSHPFSVNWQTAAGTVYGATVNPLTGVLTVDRAKITLTGNESWQKAGAYDNTYYITRASCGIAQDNDAAVCNMYKVGSQIGQDKSIRIGSNNVFFTDSDYTTKDAFVAQVAALYAASTPLEFVGRLETPLTYQLDPVQIKTIMGYNAIWANTGAIAVTYPADTRTYVDDAISAATDPDGNRVTVTGSTPSITGESGKRYVCGTVDSISITPPSTGIVDVVFTSGTTPAVLTASGVTWPGWFNPNSLDASTVYEINIQDGVYGAVMAWT